MVPVCRYIQDCGLVSLMRPISSNAPVKYWKIMLTTAFERYRKAPLYACIWTTAPESSNTRIIARCEREWERYFAYAIA